MIQLKYFLLITVFWLPAITSHAEINEYDIEIIIFEDATNRYLDSEQWPRLEHTLLQAQTETTALPDMNRNTREDTPHSGNNDVINISSTNNGTLNDYAKTLETSARYNVLIHKSWRQAGLDAESAIDIHINSEEENTSTNNTPALTVLNSELGNDNNVDQQKAASSINGQIKVILGRYLHIYTDLIYKKPNPSNSPVLASIHNDPYKVFSIKAHRRMRSKELHYIDHPLVGILVTAIPVEKPEDDNDAGESQQPHS